MAAAYAGRVDMLQAIFGGGESKNKKSAPAPLTPEAFDSVVVPFRLREKPPAEPDG